MITLIYSWKIKCCGVIQQVWMVFCWSPFFWQSRSSQFTNIQSIECAEHADQNHGHAAKYRTKSKTQPQKRKMRNARTVSERKKREKPENREGGLLRGGFGRRGIHEHLFGGQIQETHSLGHQKLKSSLRWLITSDMVTGRYTDRFPLSLSLCPFLMRLCTYTWGMFAYGSSFLPYSGEP